MDIVELSNEILKQNNIKISDIIYNIKDEQAYFDYLFSNIKFNDFDTYISNMLYHIEFKKIIVKFFRTILTKSSDLLKQEVLIHLIETGDSIEDFLLYLKKDNNIDSYCYSLQEYVRNIKLFKELFIERNDILYKLANIVAITKTDLIQFEDRIIFPLSYYDAGDYLDFVLKKLYIDINKLIYMRKEKGNFGYCFKNDKYVIKLATENRIWEIIMHYRINDFLVRRKFDKQFISICPLGKINSVNYFDIKDALKDLKDSGIIITDSNFSKNFAVVDYEIPEDSFRDVCGIKEYVDATESDTYIKKKVKLIDQDFIFKEDDPNIIYSNGYVPFE